MGGRCGRSPRATATSASSSRRRTRRPRSSRRCVRRTRAPRSRSTPSSLDPVMRILLVSTYELGHQPLHVASPAAALRGAGHEVRCLDLAVERWRADDVDWAERVAFSVPMHTAMRLALRAAEQVRRARPGLPICFYGLYAPVSRDRTLGRVADRLIAGEYEPGLLAWVRDEEPGALIQLGRGSFEPPARDLLPPLETYAHLA